MLGPWQTGRVLYSTGQEAGGFQVAKTCRERDVTGSVRRLEIRDPLSSPNPIPFLGHLAIQFSAQLLQEIQRTPDPQASSV